MHTHSWKLGERCFIASLDTSAHPIKARVMPAQVIHVTSGTATAMAQNPERFGSQFTEGIPYRTERDARAALRAELRKRLGMLGALRKLPLQGWATGFPVPEGFPSLGATVYLIEPESREVLEVVVGFLHLIEGAGYDEAPENPETSMRRIREWFADRERALAVAQKRHGMAFMFVPKEEVAARAAAAINAIWDAAAKRLRDPEWNRRHNEAMKGFIEGLKDRQPLAAG